MTTDPLDDLESRLARKAVIARALTDPLGRHGFRQTRARVEREARARRAVFVTALGVFAATLLGVAGNAAVDPHPSSTALPAVIAPASTNQDATALQAERRTQTRTSHVRTRSTD